MLLISNCKLFDASPYINKVYPFIQISYINNVGAFNCFYHFSVNGINGNGLWINAFDMDEVRCRVRVNMNSRIIELSDTIILGSET